MQKRWYEKNFRRNLVDMHIEAWNEEFLSQFEPEAYFDCLKRGKVQGPMIYTHSHVGYTNWPSKSGKMHPGFKGERKVEKLFELCNNAGMDVIAYYSLIYNNWAYDEYPQWRMLDINSEPSRGDLNLEAGDLMMKGKGRYGLLCPNNMEYRDFIKTQFAELKEHFNFKSIFLDMTFWPMVCFCDSCKFRFRKEEGKDLPMYIDWVDPEWLLFQQKREEWMTEFAYFATDEMKKVYPGVDVEHQYSTATHSWSYGVNAKHSQASDYTGGDLYGGFEQQSFICKLYYGITKNHPFEYMTSRCDPGLFDHTTTKSLEMLKLHAYLTYAHHGAFLPIDAIDPKGTLNVMFYDTLGEVFAETEPYEKYFTGNLKADIALYFSFASKMSYRTNKRETAISSGSSQHDHLRSTLGAGKALRRTQKPYKVISELDLSSLGTNKVIVLSDIVFMSEKEENALYDYVTQGGAVYISGLTSKRLVKRLLGLEIIGSTKENITYIRPSNAGDKYFEGMYNKDFPLAIFGTQMLAEGVSGHEVLATITLPYTDPKDLSIFASIHSNPPGINTQYPAIVYGSSGKGQVIWSAAPFESSEQQVHKKVFVNLLSLLEGESLVKSNAGQQIEFTVFEDQESLLLHCINIQEHLPIIPQPGFEVSVRVPGNIKHVIKLPECNDVEFGTENGYVKFTIEAFDIFAMYQLCQ